ncbi:hypothetical protein ARMGADRAFT_1035524 [Armillaria gallica]|uniref:Uncharacterized protein n=1 Tax=Armillaria gallica TaxID=47427 RepID=A0A2H3CUE8_ARMGA|nr:hypothetical protein ARMGADRAFT_1035524 [Armillaria gallica]
MTFLTQYTACRPKAQTIEELLVKEHGDDKPLSVEALAEEEAVLGAFADIFGLPADMHLSGNCFYNAEDYKGDKENGNPDVQQMVAIATTSIVINSKASASQLAEILDATVSPIQLQHAVMGLPMTNPKASIQLQCATMVEPWSLGVLLGEELNTCWMPPEIWSEQWNPASLLPGTSGVPVNTNDLDLSFMINDISLFLPDADHPTALDVTMAPADYLNTGLEAGIVLFDQYPPAKHPNGAIFFSIPQPDNDTGIFAQSDSGEVVISVLLKELNGPAQTFSPQELRGNMDKPITSWTSHA